ALQGVDNTLTHRLRLSAVADEVDHADTLRGARAHVLKEPQGPIPAAIIDKDEFNTAPRELESDKRLHRETSGFVVTGDDDDDRRPGMWRRHAISPTDRLSLPQSGVDPEDGAMATRAPPAQATNPKCT